MNLGIQGPLSYADLADALREAGWEIMRHATRGTGEVWANQAGTAILTFQRAQVGWNRGRRLSRSTGSPSRCWCRS